MAKSPQIIHNNITSNSTIWSSTWGIRSSFQVLTVILFALVICVLYFSQGHGSGSSMSPSSSPSLEIHSVVRDSMEEIQMMPGCDYFSGKWVYDNETYPLYKEKECSFMSDQLACEKFGRKDLSYQYWRWQPYHCDLPRFNATALLEKLRNKRLVYVGDSLNRGQWISMICLVDSSIPSSLKSMQTNGSLSIFKAIEYNATIEFYWAPMLIESNSDDPVKHRVPERIVRTQAIEKHARHWTNADFLVFDSYLWWKRPFMKVLWGSFESSDGIYKEVEMLKGYEMALRTWSDWLEIHVNHSKTQIFWMSMSPTHERSEDWGGVSGLNCYNETQSIKKKDYWGSGSDTNMMRLVEAEIENLNEKGLNIQILNITQLSEYRKEGHPSIHRKQWEPLTDEQLSNPSGYADCIHWCLPGVPDTWNEILYTYINSSL
ncbi:protein trichome birefringence-like 34 [Chenopodium quinoa]|uniref:protein trichome birefringence-like 34 n=1 Tax=Chenopodium quinoa TaxID=63459 RepID=UPI000B78A387|nr:protein trichome birefringence-like 34 [Chenopodium quinoa]